MPYMIGANPAYMYNRGYLLINRTKTELEKLKGVTVINITEDHLFLPADFDDYFSLFLQSYFYCFFKIFGRIT